MRGIREDVERISQDMGGYWLDIGRILAGYQRLATLPEVLRKIVRYSILFEFSPLHKEN